MNDAQWRSLKRGDLLCSKQTGTVLQVVGEKRNEDGSRVLLLLLMINAGAPADWDQVNDAGQILDEHGVVVSEPAPPGAPTAAPKMARPCLLCESKLIVSNKLCPRCVGSGHEPAGLKETVIDVRVFWTPGKESGAPHVFVGTQAGLTAEQIQDALGVALEIAKTQFMDRSKPATSSSLVN